MEPIDGGASFRAALAAYLEDPDCRTWDELAHKIIPGAGGHTMWQAWIMVDGRAPLQGPPSRLGDPPPTPEQTWPVLPYPFTVRRALRVALKGEIPHGLGKLLAARQSARVPRGRP
jgi:hypothetical protein